MSLFSLIIDVILILPICSTVPAGYSIQQRCKEQDHWKSGREEYDVIGINHHMLVHGALIVAAFNRCLDCGLSMLLDADGCEAV